MKASEFLAAFNRVQGLPPLQPWQVRYLDALEARQAKGESRIPQSTNAAGAASYSQAPPAVTDKTREGEVTNAKRGRPKWE